MRIISLLASVALVVACGAVAEAQRDHNPIDLTGRVSNVLEKHFFRAYYWHKDITFLLTDENTKETWRIVSRDMVPNEARWLFGPTYTGLAVDWKSGPRASWASMPWTGPTHRVETPSTGRKPSSTISNSTRRSVAPP